MVEAATTECSVKRTQLQCVPSESACANPKKSRQGRGTHGLTIVRQLLLDRENWKIIQSKHDYQFPGVFEDEQMQAIYYTPDVFKLDEADLSNPHFMWDDIQLSKGKLNKDRLVTVEVASEKVNLMYRSAPCNGVKLCPVESCNFVAPMSQQRPCPLHTDMPLKKSTCDGSMCPVEIAYLYPPNPSENKQRWILAFVRHPKGLSTNLHNHPPTTTN